MWGRTLSVFSAGRLGGSSARWGGRGVAHVYLRHRIHLVAAGKAAFNAAAAFLCLHKLVEIFTMHCEEHFWLGISGAWVGEELAGWAWQFWNDPSPGGPSSSAAIPSLPGRPQHGPQRCGPRRDGEDELNLHRRVLALAAAGGAALASRYVENWTRNTC